MTYFTECPDRKTMVKKVAARPCILAVFIGFAMLLLQVFPGGFIGATIHSLSNAAIAPLFVWF